MIFEEVVEKTQYYHSLRKVRAPKALEDGIAAAAAWHEKMARNSSDATAAVVDFCKPVSRSKQSSRSSRAPHERNSGSDQVLSSEFRNYTFLPETQFYARQGRMSQSPQSVEGPVTELSSNPPETGPSGMESTTTVSRVDIDWVCKVAKQFMK
jgi:hypothetical protein